MLEKGDIKTEECHQSLIDKLKIFDKCKFTDIEKLIEDEAFDELGFEEVEDGWINMKQDETNN